MASETRKNIVPLSVAILALTIPGGSNLPISNNHVSHRVLNCITNMPYQQEKKLAANAKREREAAAAKAAAGPETEIKIKNKSGDDHMSDDSS
jgi:hypothetical protein